MTYEPNGVRCARLWLRASFVLVTCYTAIGPGYADEHPRLWLRAGELEHVRHACGVVAAADLQGAGRFGARAREFNELRTHYARRVDDFSIAGETAGAAFLLRVAPSDPAAANCLKLVKAQLSQPITLTTDVFELAVALDWAWDALDSATRREFLHNVRRWARPLSPADSPLDHRTFREKLGALAVAIVVQDDDAGGSAFGPLRQKIISTARTYFKNTLPVFVAWRGLAPTGPAAAAFEESDTVLAIELAAALLGPDVWQDYAASVGRWMEHYVYAEARHPGLRHQFLREDAARCSLSPAPAMSEMLPVTAHLLAARTHDSAAVLLARRIRAQLVRPENITMGRPWLWVPIVFDTAALRAADPDNLPAARNLGGAIVFRGENAELQTGVWIEASQPYLRRGQHFDAGHFLIRADGRLTIQAGDDVALEATTGKGGRQRLGRLREPFAFEQFAGATIAHNCLLIWEPTRIARWHGRKYEPRGGQRLIENTCRNFTGEIADNPRSAGRIAAYGSNRAGQYAALDLTSAYSRRAVQSYTREFIFLGGRALVVIDRVKLRRGTRTPISVVNIPSRPLVDGGDLPADARVAGPDNTAGVWRLKKPASLYWTELDGALWCKPLLPEQMQVSIVGGPARLDVVPNGPHAGRKYVGGAAETFERLVIPSTRHKPRNAWYSLESPSLLGEHFAKAPVWGRIEIEPRERTSAAVFATVFVAQRAGDSRKPSAAATVTAEGLAVTVDLPGLSAKLLLPNDMRIGGRIEISGDTTAAWTLPAGVMADAPLPTGAPPAGTRNEP